MKSLDLKPTLLSQLVVAYPNRVRTLAGGPIQLRVDDRDGDDIYPGFCDINLSMSDPDGEQFQLILNNIPFDDDLKVVAADLDGCWQSTRSGERLILNLSASKRGQLVRLAKAIRQVVGRGKCYLDRNWRWIAPRTGKSLERLAQALTGCIR